MRSRYGLLAALIFFGLLVVGGLVYVVQALVSVGVHDRIEGEHVLGPAIVVVLLALVGLVFAVPLAVSLFRKLRGPRLP